MARQRPASPRQRALELYERLRERICLLDYEPGTIVKERDLALEFGVSRTPLRRVLQWLERDGLIQPRQGFGTVVTEIDLQDLRDVYFLRIRLAEIIGASGPLPPKPEMIAALRELADRCREMMGKPDHRAFQQVNIGLHRQIQTLIRNRPMREIADTLFYRTSRVWFRLLETAQWDQELEELELEIREMLRHLERGDVESAGYVRRNHLAKVVQRFDTIGRESE